MLAGLEARGARSVFVRYLQSLGGHPTSDAVLAAIAATLAWGPLMRKRISRQTAESLPWWLRLFGTMIGASVDAQRHTAESFCGISVADLLGKRSLTEVACVALIGQNPTPADLFAFQTLGGPAADQWSGRDLRPGCERRHFCRRPGGARTSPVQQGARRISHPLRLRPRRQRLRRRGLPARALQGRTARRSVRSEARARSQGHGDRIRAQLRRGARQAQGDGRGVGAGAALHQSPGVQGQAGQHRSARRVRAQSSSRSAANTTSSTTITARWCKCSTTRT